MFATILLLAVGWVPDDWYPFEPESKAFQVALPARPSRTASRSVAGPAGQAQLTSARLETADGVYSVQVIENPARVDPTTLDEGIRQFAATRQATHGPLTTITVDGNPGRQFELTAGQTRSRVRFVAAGSTLFVLSAAGTSGGDVPADAEKFLGSLAIGTPAAAKANIADAEAKAKVKAEAAEAEMARVRAETELARTKADLAQAKAQAENDRVRAEADLARAKARSTADFTNATDASVTVSEAEKGDDDPKNAAKAPARKSNAPVRVVISRMPKGAKPYADQDLQDLSKSFANDRDGFRDIGPEGSVLVGVRVSYVERFGGPKVRSAQPIYRSGGSYYAGRIYGEVVGPMITVVARPDYAVGGLVTHTGLTVDGFGIVFMRVDGDHLDPNDTYNSSWIGDRKGGSPGGVTTRGKLVVGLQGRARDEVNALGLTSQK